MPRVKKIFFLRSGLRNALAKAESTPVLSFSANKLVSSPEVRRRNLGTQDRTTLPSLDRKGAIHEPGSERC
jgi:hypothetical protein